MLSDRLKELRNKHKLTQAQFADIFNVSPATIGMWETNKRTPDLEMLKKIANHFDVSLDYLSENDTSEYTKKSFYNDSDLKFALFGDVEIDDEVLDEVRHYAQIAKQMREEKKKNDKSQ